MQAIAEEVAGKKDRQQESVQEVTENDIADMPVKEGWSGLWDIMVRVKGEGEI